AAHLKDGSLDPDLATLSFGCTFMDFESHSLRSGERNEPGLWMLHDGITEGRAGTRAEVDDAIRHARLFKHLHEPCGDGRRIAGGLEDHGIAGHDRRSRHARHDGEGKVPWRNDSAYSQRNIQQFIALAGKLNRRGGLRKPHGLARVELQKVDGLTD